MDPITAWANATVAICNLITQLLEGQTPAQRAQAWEWFMADQARWRHFFHIPDLPPPASAPAPPK